MLLLLMVIEGYLPHSISRRFLDMESLMRFTFLHEILWPTGLQNTSVLPEFKGYWNKSLDLEVK